MEKRVGVENVTQTEPVEEISATNTLASATNTLASIGLENILLDATGSLQSTVVEKRVGVENVAPTQPAEEIPIDSMTTNVKKGSNPNKNKKYCDQCVNWFGKRYFNAHKCRARTNICRICLKKLSSNFYRVKHEEHCKERKEKKCKIRIYIYNVLWCVCVCAF